MSISACGSFREELAPGTFVLVDQFIDRTFARAKSFFGPGLVAHVSLGHPVCPRLGDALEEAAGELSIPYRRGGTYLVMEGPQFSTLAESNLYRGWGCDVIGMTNMPEAKLAREAEMCYATVAMVTDYDCWHPDHDHVTVEAIIKVLMENADKGRALVKQVAPKLSGRALSRRLPQGARLRHHHRPRGARRGHGRQARRRRRAGAEVTGGGPASAVEVASRGRHRSAPGEP